MKAHSTLSFSKRKVMAPPRPPRGEIKKRAGKQEDKAQVGHSLRGCAKQALDSLLPQYPPPTLVISFFPGRGPFTSRRKEENCGEGN